MPDIVPHALHVLIVFNPFNSYNQKLLLLVPGEGCFPGVSAVKNLPAHARDAKDGGSIPGFERSPGVGNGNSSLPWETPWTEEPGGLQSTALQTVKHN